MSPRSHNTKIIDCALINQLQTNMRTQRKHSQFLPCTDSLLIDLYILTYVLRIFKCRLLTQSHSMGFKGNSGILYKALNVALPSRMILLRSVVCSPNWLSNKQSHQLHAISHFRIQDSFYKFNSPRILQSVFAVVYT